MTTFRRTFCGLLALLISCNLFQGQAPTSVGNDSCRRFVQAFYDWYLPRAKKTRGTASNLVLKYRSTDLSLELRKRLKEDSDAQARSRDLVGLDFDPFLNTQDDSFERCTVEHVFRKNSNYWAQVTCVFPGPNPSKAQIMPEVMPQGERWQFVNFHYHDDSGDTDLLSILKDLQNERQPKKK